MPRRKKRSRPSAYYRITLTIDAATQTLVGDATAHHWLRKYGCRRWERMCDGWSIEDGVLPGLGESLESDRFTICQACLDISVASMIEAGRTKNPALNWMPDFYFYSRNARIA